MDFQRRLKVMDEVDKVRALVPYRSAEEFSTEHRKREITIMNRFYKDQGLDISLDVINQALQNIDDELKPKRALAVIQHSNDEDESHPGWFLTYIFLGTLIAFCLSYGSDSRYQNKHLELGNASAKSFTCTFLKEC